MIKVAEILVGKMRSVIYRVLIILVATIIINTSENYFTEVWYYIAMIPYFIIFFWALLYKGGYSIIRLINDFLFIGLVIIGKDVTIGTITICLLPIMNNPNHDGDKRTWLVFMLTFLLLFYLIEFQFDINFVLILSMLFTFLIVGLLVERKFKFYKESIELSQVVDKYLENTLDFEDTHLVYKGLIGILNGVRPNYFFRAKFDQILCFRVLDNHLHLVNSYPFIWEYELSHKEVQKLFALKNTRDVVFRVNIKLNDEWNNYQNIAITSKTKTANFLFVVIFQSDHIPIKLFDNFYNEVLKHTFARISNFLEMKENLMNLERDSLDSLKEKYFYVQNAVKVMHYLKNNFSPLDNFLTLTPEFLDSKLNEKEKNIYKKEMVRVRNNLDEVLKRADNILDKSVSPFNSIDTEKVKVKYLFDVLRKNWIHFFAESKLHVEFVNETSFNKEVRINSDGMNIIFTDWLSNIKKYSESKESAVFKLKKDGVEICFINDVKSDDFEKLKRLVSDFKSESRNEILKRRSHGVIILKNILDEMNISGNLEFNNGDLKFTINLDYC